MDLVKLLFSLVIPLVFELLRQMLLWQHQMRVLQKLDQQSENSYGWLRYSDLEPIQQLFFKFIPLADQYY